MGRGASNLIVAIAAIILALVGVIIGYKALQPAPVVQPSVIIVTVTPQVGISPVQPSNVQQNSSNSGNIYTPYCAFVTANQVETLKTIQGVQAAITQAEDFSGHSQNNYKKGDIVPKGVMIATDLQSTDLQNFGVVPVNNQGGWGLFITSYDLKAPNDGIYWCIH